MARDSSSTLSSCFRWLLFVFNFIVFCSGIVLAALGAWILIDSWWFLSLRHTTLIDEDNNNINAAANRANSYDNKNAAVMLLSTPGELNSHISPANTFMHIACYVMICTGVLVALVAFLGCLSAMANARVLLTIYLTLLLAAICMEIFSATYVMSRQPYRGADQVLRETLRVTLQKAYLGDEYVQGQDRSAELNLVTMAWNELMMKLQCCGVNGSRDFVYDRLPQGYRANGNLPVVCCKLKEHGRKRPFALEPRDSQCQALPNNDNSYMRTGCYRALWDWLSSTAITILIATAAVVLVQVVAICITCCLLVNGGWLSRNASSSSSSKFARPQQLVDGIIHTQTRLADDDEEEGQALVVQHEHSEVQNGVITHLLASPSAAKANRTVLVTASNNTSANESEKFKTSATTVTTSAARPVKPPKPAGLMAGVSRASAASSSPKVSTTTITSPKHEESTASRNMHSDDVLAARLAHSSPVTNEGQQKTSRSGAAHSSSNYRIQDNPIHSNTSKFVVHGKNNEVLIEDFAIDEHDARHFESEKQRFMTTPTMTTKMLHAKISGSGINSPLLSGIRQQKQPALRSVDAEYDGSDEDKQPMLAAAQHQHRSGGSSRTSSAMGSAGVATIPVINDRKVTQNKIVTTTTTTFAEARGARAGTSSIGSSSPRTPHSATSAHQQQHVQRVQVLPNDGAPPAWKRNGAVMPEFSL